MSTRNTHGAHCKHTDLNDQPEGIGCSGCAGRRAQPPHPRGAPLPGSRLRGLRAQDSATPPAQPAPRATTPPKTVRLRASPRHPHPAREGTEQVAADDDLEDADDMADDVDLDDVI